MTHVRHLLLAVAATGAALLPGPVRAATQNASVTANVLKPLTLQALQNLDLGTITLGSGTWSGAKVGISRTGVFTCATAQLICTGAPRVARYKVTGSNKQIVRITAPSVTLLNQADSSKTLVMTVDSPGTVALTSSGMPGNDFDLGGTLTLSSTTAPGDYLGTFNVTVDYQ
jgi:spore coat protein U-like protein